MEFQLGEDCERAKKAKSNQFIFLSTEKLLISIAAELTAPPTELSSETHKNTLARLRCNLFSNQHSCTYAERRVWLAETEMSKTKTNKNKIREFCVILRAFDFESL